MSVMRHGDVYRAIAEGFRGEACFPLNAWVSATPLIGIGM